MVSLRCLAFAAALAMPVFVSGCGGPSQIQVTGFRQMQSENLSGPDQEEPASDVVSGTGNPTRSASGPEASGEPGSSPADAADPPAGAGAAQTDDPVSGQIAVYISGAVNRPGVCYLPAGARICDALEEAGGFTAEADSQWLNQARTLADGEMLVVYTAAETAQMKEQGIARGSSALEDVSGYSQNIASGTGQGMAAGTAEGSGSLVNLNTATREQLMTLPGIGEAKADAIIRYRTETGLFASTEDVMNISGIKNSVYEKIRDRVTV